MLRFRALVTKEGSKASSIRVTVPKKTVAALRLPAPCWVRIRVNGGSALFAWARRPPSRNSVDVGLTQRHFPISMAGTEVDVDIEHAEPYRAVAWTGQHGFDWLPFVPPEHYFPTETIDGKMLLHNRYEEPFVMKRVTPLPETYRMLGVYQAEGSKSLDAPDFSLGNSNALLLVHIVELLGTWGLDRSRLALEVLREPGADPAVTRTAYEQLGVEIVAERVRTGPGGKAATLHVRKSQPLLRLVKAALAKVFDEKFPSEEAAREYALGWLDGDGSITVLKPIPGRRGHCLELRLAGYEAEQNVVLRALHYGFGWRTKGGSFTDVRWHRTRSLDVREGAELALAGAFRFSLNRVRLLYEIERRCAGGIGRLDEMDLAHARQLLEQLRPEIETLRRLMPPERVPVGVKGLEYPVAVAPYTTLK